MQTILAYNLENTLWLIPEDYFFLWYLVIIRVWFIFDNQDHISLFSILGYSRESYPRGKLHLSIQLSFFYLKVLLLLTFKLSKLGILYRLKGEKSKVDANSFFFQRRQISDSGLERWSTKERARISSFWGISVSSSQFSQPRPVAETCR